MITIMGHTLVPQAVSGLVALLSGYSELAGVEVFDGGPSGGNLPEQLIAVCYSSDETTPPVQGVQSPAALGANLPRVEEFTIRNEVSVANGDDDLAAARVLVFTLFSAIEDAVRDNPEFAAPGTFGEITEYSYSQDITDEGAVATIVFMVHELPFRYF